MKARNLLVSALVSISCSSSPSLEDYALELSVKSKPDKSIEEFYKEFSYLPPDELIIKAHSKLLSGWSHVNESEGSDDIMHPGSLLSSGSLQGDCEDFSVFMMAICRLEEIDAFFALGHSNDGLENGHVWLEIPIARLRDYDHKLRTRFEKMVNNEITIYNRSDTVWLALIEPKSITRYFLEYRVTAMGRLITEGD